MPNGTSYNQQLVVCLLTLYWEILNNEINDLIEKRNATLRQDINLLWRLD